MTMAKTREASLPAQVRKICAGDYVVAQYCNDTVVAGHVVVSSGDRYYIPGPHGENNMLRWGASVEPLVKSVVIVKEARPSAEVILAGLIAEFEVWGTAARDNGRTDEALAVDHVITRLLQTMYIAGRPISQKAIGEAAAELAALTYSRAYDGIVE